MHSGLIRQYKYVDTVNHYRRVARRTLNRRRQDRHRPVYGIIAQHKYRRYGLGKE